MKGTDGKLRRNAAGTVIWMKPLCSLTCVTRESLGGTG